jgi:hypothetical protein
MLNRKAVQKFEELLLLLADDALPSSSKLKRDRICPSKSDSLIVPGLAIVVTDVTFVPVLPHLKLAEGSSPATAGPV